MYKMKIKWQIENGKPHVEKFLTNYRCCSNADSLETAVIPLFVGPSGHLANRELKVSQVLHQLVNKKKHTPIIKLF